MRDHYIPTSVQFSHVQLFVTPWTAARQASLSISNSQSLLKLMSLESVMPSNRLILCCPPLFLPSIFPSIRVFVFKKQTLGFSQDLDPIFLTVFLTILQGSAGPPLCGDNLPIQPILTSLSSKTL